MSLVPFLLPPFCRLVFITALSLFSFPLYEFLSLSLPFIWFLTSESDPVPDRLLLPTVSQWERDVASELHFRSDCPKSRVFRDGVLNLEVRGAFQISFLKVSQSCQAVFFPQPLCLHPERVQSIL